MYLFSYLTYLKVLILTFLSKINKWPRLRNPVSSIIKTEELLKVGIRQSWPILFFHITKSIVVSCEHYSNGYKCNKTKNNRNNSFKHFSTTHIQLWKLTWMWKWKTTTGFEFCPQKVILCEMYREVTTSYIFYFVF